MSKNEAKEFLLPQTPEAKNYAWGKTAVPLAWGLITVFGIYIPVQITRWMDKGIESFFQEVGLFLVVGTAFTAAVLFLFLHKKEIDRALRNPAYKKLIQKDSGDIVPSHHRDYSVWH